MLREKLKHFKTIKLKRHHYVLGGFGIAAIVVFASIFGFQDIGTHAKEAEYPNITIPANNICTVINDTQVNVNGTGEINIYCKLGACHEEGEVIPNSILGGYNEKINISSMGNAVCLAACSSEKETNCLEANKLSQLQYDNIFTFTFEGISAGTSDIKLLANSFEGNNEADGQQITVNQSNNTYSVSCNWQTDTPGVDAGERGTIDLYCGAADLPLFSDLRSIITITNNDNETINPKEITQGEWDNENETRYVLSFLGNRSGFVNLQINGTLYDKGDSYTFIDKNIGTVKVNGKSAQSGGPDCSIYGDSPVNLNNEGTITLTCKGKKLGYINENLKAQTALDYSGNIEVKSEPEEIIPSDSSITIKYTFTGIVEGTGHLKLNEGIIIEEGSTPNGAVEGNEISVIDNIKNVSCEWLNGGDVEIDVGDIGSMILSCDLKNIHLKPELLTVEDETKLEILSFTPTGDTNYNGWFNYEVQYKGLEDGEITLIIGGEYSNEYTIPNTESPTITVNNKEIEPLKCSIIATGDTVYVNETGKIVVTCETKMVKNEILNSSDLDYSGYIIEVQPTANRQLGNAGVFTYEFEYTGKRTPHTYLKLRAGVLFDSDTNATNEEQEYRNGITVLEQISVDPIKCDIIATGHTVYINETGNIVVTCDGTGYSDLTNTGLDYSGNITVSTNSDKQEESNKTKYTFTYTGDIAGRSHLKLLTNAIGNTQNGSTPATFATGITVLENIPDCNPNWDNNKFITPEFWKLDPAPTDPQIACALYGSGGDDQTAYTMGWDGYQGGISCTGYSSMQVVSGTSLPLTLSENTIYVITSTGFTTSNEIVLPKCSAIISNQIDGKDAVIKTTNSNMGIAINKSYGILDNISVHGNDGNIGILVQGQSNTLNVVKVYNRKKGIFVDRGIHNLLNNIQSYGNQNGIHVKAENNAINNTQIYRNDIGLDVDRSTNNIVYNTEIYQNKTGLNVGQLSSNNTFDSIEFVANDLNLYVLSGLESQNYAKWLLMGPLPITKVYEFEDMPLDEYSNLTSVLSGFDRVLLRSDLERSYIFECEGGPSATYKYTGNNQIDLTLTAGEICSEESRGDYLGRYTMRTGRTDGTIIETRPLLTASGGILSYSSSYVYPNNMTNPQYVNGIYLNNWYIVHKGHAQINNNIQSYSYGYDIKTQKDVKLRDNNIGGEVNGKYFIGSNVQKYEISGNIGKHTKVHYTITGTATDTSEIKKYNIYQIPQNIHSTIDRYIGPTRTKHTLTGRINQIKEIDINSGVEIYIETGDTSSYPVIVQMYGEGEIGPERNDYFAEHRYIGALNRQAPTFEIQPGNMCTKEEIINMTGTWTGFEYNMTGFDFDDITVTGYASRVTGSFAPGTRTGVYTRKISLSGGEGRVYVVGNTSEDILEFGNAQSETRRYNRDIYAPVIETEGFTIPECTGKILDVDAHDVGCKGMKDYKLEGELGNIDWTGSSIFRISENTIGRTGGIIKTGLVYARDGFDNTKTGIIVGTITNIPPTITSGQTQEAPYEYGTITGETTISQSEVIEMLGANEGVCGIDDLSIESVSCDSNAQGTLLNDGSIKIYPLYNNATTCNVVIKDNEDNEENEEYSRVTGYIKFTASDIQSTTHNCHWSTPNPQIIKIAQGGTIGLTCDGINFNELTQAQRDNIISAITLSNPSKLSYITDPNTIIITYTGAEIGTTKFQFAGAELNGTLTLGSADSELITVYEDIYSCTRGNPTENPIGEGVQAYIDLICNNFQNHGEDANAVWNVVSYSGNSNTIYTGTAQWITSGVRFIYTGHQIGTIQVLASGDSQGYLYNSNGWSPIIEVIDYESNRPNCTITGTEMVTLGQSGTITVICNSNYGITTTQLSTNDLDYSGNILVSDTSDIVIGTGNTKTFTFTFTGNIIGVSNLGLKTGSVINIPGIGNKYETGNNIRVITGNGGIHTCTWETPEPDILGIGQSGTMILNCIDDPRIAGFLKNSGDSVTGELSRNNHRILNYTGEHTGDTQYAISGTIGNAHIQTVPYRSNIIKVTDEGIILDIDPNSKISNQNIIVNMSGKNANWVKYYKTGTSIIDFNVCEEEGIDLTENEGEYNGTETITNAEECVTYIYLCGALGLERTGMIKGTYIIDTTEPECEITADPTEWTKSGVTLSVSNIIELHPNLYSWTGFNESYMTNTTGTKTVYTTGIYNFYMKDAAGNTGICSTGVTNIDTEGPTGDITYINGNGEYGNSCTTGSVTIILNTGESISGYPELAFARNSTGDDAWTGNNTRTVTENESGTGYIRDNAGNILPLPYNVTGIVTAGPTAPVLSNPGNGVTIPSSNIEFNWEGSTPDNCATISGYTMYILSFENSERSVERLGNTNGTSITPISLPNGTYTRYVGVSDNFGQTGVSEGRTFTIDSSMPTCDITYEPPFASGRTNGNVTGTLTNCDSNVSQIITGTNVFTQNGYLPFSFKDLSDNTWIMTGHVHRIDKEAPSCEITASEPADGQVTLTLAFSGEQHPDQSGYSWDGLTYGDDNTLEISVDGTYTGYVKDLAGNTGYCEKTVSDVNTTAPTVYATNSSTTWKTGNIDITMYVTGINLSGANYITGNNIESFESCKSTGIPYTDGTEITWETEGTGYLTLCAYDVNGNTGYWTGMYKLDKTDPVCGTWSYNPSLTQWTNTSVTATLGGSTDNISGIRTGGGSCNITTLNGTCNIEISDYAGRTTTCTSSGATNIDNQDPTGDIIITYLSGQLINGCTSGNVKLTLTGIDNNELAEEPYKWNDGNWTTNNTRIITENEKGTGYIRDAAGNVTGIAYDITGISQTGPTISLNTPYSGAVLTGFVHFEWGVVASNSICQALSGGYNIAVYSGTEEVYTRNTGSTTIDTTLPDGTYTWNVSTTDILGHISESETRPFTIKTGAPTCEIEYTPAESLGWTGGNVRSLLTGCSEGATGFNATGHLFTENLAYYEFTFRNELGITGNAMAHVTRIDKDPPVLYEVTPIGITTDTTPDYTFSSTESGTIAYSGACSSNTTWAVSGDNTITLNALPVGTYSGCTITVTDIVGNVSEVLNISEFTIKSSGGGGGGGSTLKKDDCPDGDYSDSYYDGTCEGSHKSDETRDICKVNESNYSDEMKLAYLYAYVHGMTTMCPIDDADLYGYLRRDHLAKILTQYSINVLDLEPEVGKAGCNDFDDIANESAEMKYFIRTSCELGLMGLESDGKTPKKSFDPTKYVTRAEFGTTLSRLIYEGKYNLASEAENTYPGAWYSKHLQALKKAEIMNEIDGDRPQHIELRGYVMLMVMRYGKGRLADMVTDEDANSYYMNNIYTKGNKEMSCTVYSGGKKIGDLYIEGNDIKEYNKTSGVSVLIKNNVLYTRSDSSKKGVSKKYTISVFNFLKKFNDEEISVQCTQGVDSDELIKPKNITFLSV